MKRLLGGAALLAIAATMAMAQSVRRAEDEFVRILLQHQQDGIEMAHVAEEKAKTAAVKALARRVRQSLERDARQLKPFVSSDPVPLGTTGQRSETEHGLDHYTNTSELKSGLAHVRGATGKDVDVAFLNEMARHYEVALTLARETRFKTPRLKQLAERMAATQQKDIRELKLALQQLP